MDAIINSYDFDVSQATEIVKKFLLAMDLGLSSDDHGADSLPQVPTFADLPHGDEKGKFFALDFGGSGIQCFIVDIDHKQVKVTHNAKKRIASSIPTGQQLFGTLAEYVKEFIEEDAKDSISKDDYTQNPLLGGFSFSFPIQQDDIHKGTLLYWGKEFIASGVVGQDVIQLLHESLDQIGLNWIRMCALCNDSVCTLVTEALQDEDICISLVLGTGANACYREKSADVKKVTMKRNGFMAINTEMGAFTGFPRTVEDDIILSKTIIKGVQTFEKQISGRYIPLIVCECMERGMRERVILKNWVQEKFGKESVGKQNDKEWQYFQDGRHLTAAAMSKIRDDKSNDLNIALTYLNLCLGQKPSMHLLNIHDTNQSRNIPPSSLSPLSLFPGVLPLNSINSYSQQQSETDTLQSPSPVQIHTRQYTNFFSQESPETSPNQSASGDNPLITFEDVQIFQRLIQKIMERSEKYLAVALTGLIVRIVAFVDPNRRNIHVAAGGSLLNGSSDFREHVEAYTKQALQIVHTNVCREKPSELLPQTFQSETKLELKHQKQIQIPQFILPEIKLIPSRDGSGLGAGIIASMSVPVPAPESQV
ncbi:MAG: Hexokinase [Streblomastix strix]|uniref:Phosphotransferase n=1 Tax=Streblomastix strix TaxID=222440 RepID=A0A5J4WP62_9EUKA|nr:MAG: Hexokinase [Streblomastix strix]